ncbi:hypothetical protein N341_03532, partial [Tyto alba]
GQLQLKVPFSVTDLRSWKELAGTYRKDPEKVSKVFETIIRTQDPDSNDIQVVLVTLLTFDERTMVIAKAKEEAERINVNDHFSPVDPQWDPNNPAQRQLLTRYQRLIVFGMKYAIPKAINLFKLYQIIQGKEESPSHF